MLRSRVFFSQDRLIKCGKAFLKARQHLHENDGGLGPADVFFALDNQKPGLQQKFTDFLKDSNGKKDHLQIRKFTLVYDFDSVRARKLRVKGLGTVNQTETMLAVTAGEALSIPIRKHKHYLDTNNGSIIGMVKLPPYIKCWTMKYEQKKLLYGKMRVPVGGKEEQDGDDNDEEDGENEVPPTVDDFQADASKKQRASTRAADNIEPVHYHTLPEEFFDNLQDVFFVKDLYDFTPSPEAALALLKAKKGYIGICFNDFHQKLLREYVIDKVLESFGTANDPLFHASYAAGLKNTASAVPTPTPTPKAKPKPEAKATGKKDKKKDKKRKKNSSSSSSDSGTSA